MISIDEYLISNNLAFLGGCSKDTQLIKWLTDHHLVFSIW